MAPLLVKLIQLKCLQSSVHLQKRAKSTKSIYLSASDTRKIHCSLYVMCWWEVYINNNFIAIIPNWSPLELIPNALRASFSFNKAACVT